MRRKGGKMAKGKISEILSGYEKDAEYGTKFRSYALTGNVTRTRARVVRRILGTSNAVMNTFAYSSTRSYGLFMIGFGFLSFLLHAIRNYVAGAQIPLYVIVASVVLSLLGIPLVCFDKAFSLALQDFTPTDRLFFDFFCLKRMHRIDFRTARRGEDAVWLVKPYLALVVGLLLASLTMLVPMWYILVILGAVVYLFLTFISPEFSFFSILLAMPYLGNLAFSDYILGVAVLLTFISFIVKVALGKRVYHFEQYDLLLGLFLLFVLISGIFVKGIASFGASLILILFAMGYVLASSLISNRRLADCVINAMIISAIPVSAEAVLLAVMSLVKNGFSGFTPVSASFDSPDSLAVYLLVVAVFTLYYIRATHIPAARFGYAVIFVLVFLALVSTASIWAFVVGFFGVVAYILSGFRRTGPLLVGILAVIPYSLLFLPAPLVSFIDSLPGASSLDLPALSLGWRASVKMLFDNLFVGVGIGSDSFMHEIVYYIPEKLTDSSNLLLEIGCEAGIFALLVFSLMLLVRLFHKVAYRRYVGSSRVRHLSTFASVAMCMLLVFGAVNYLFSDLILNLLYWCVFGIGSAALRIAKREHDDLYGYFSDGRSNDASSIDVDIF